MTLFCKSCSLYGKDLVFQVLFLMRQGWIWPCFAGPVLDEEGLNMALFCRSCSRCGKVVYDLVLQVLLVNVKRLYMTLFCRSCSRCGSTRSCVRCTGSPAGRRRTLWPRPWQPGRVSLRNGENNSSVMIQILFRNNVQKEPCKCKMLKRSVPDYRMRYSDVLQSRLTCEMSGKTGITRIIVCLSLHEIAWLQRRGVSWITA